LPYVVTNSNNNVISSSGSMYYARTLNNALLNVTAATAVCILKNTLEYVCNLEENGIRRIGLRMLQLLVTQYILCVINKLIK